MGFDTWNDQNPWSLWGQPIANLESGEVLGTEFLLRPLDGRPPGALLGRAAGAGFLANLEEAIIRKALAMSAEGLRFINVSAWALPRIYLDTDLSGVVIEVTEQHRADPDLPRVLWRLRQNGARFALDDVASGWGRLAGLVDWHPEYVKLDWPLIHGIDHDPTRQNVVWAVIGLSRDLGSTVIAEGIETAEELTYLRKQGVTLGQGLLLGRPAPILKGEVLSARCG